jgi:hypothetical protein
VRVACLLAEEGQSVLLSPASSSFDEFGGYEERGDRFAYLVQEYVGSGGEQEEPQPQDELQPQEEPQPRAEKKEETHEITDTAEE